MDTLQQKEKLKMEQEPDTKADFMPHHLRVLSKRGYQMTFPDFLSHKELSEKHK